jgi:hypothetical protein
MLRSKCLGIQNVTKGTKVVVKELRGIWNQQEKSQTLGKFLKVLEEEEAWKYNPNMEQNEYKIGQNTTIMKTTNKKVKECNNKHHTKIVKLVCL